MQKTMRALVKKYDRPGLWMDEVPVPTIGIDDVLIKIKKTAICGTDLHIYNWDEWAKKTVPCPMVVGHEYVGVIAAVGANVKGFELGELVSGEGHIVCGHCRNCRAGRLHLCKNTMGVGVNRPGAYAEYLSLPASNVWRCDTRIPEEVLACFDPFGNAVHTTLTYNLVGEDVLITGAGPIGIMAVAVAKHAGARNVVITDINPYRLELAKKMGATRAVNVKNEKLKDVMKDLGMTEGFDVGLEMSGNKQAFGDMLEHMIPGGNIAMLGILPNGTGIDWDQVVFKSLNIKGIYGRKMFETWYQMTVLVQSGLDIRPMITHRLSVKDFEKGFELMNSGQSGKVVLSWD
jgi:threonine 3-dehydrogenase